MVFWRRLSLNVVKRPRAHTFPRSIVEHNRGQRALSTIVTVDQARPTCEDEPLTASSDCHRCQRFSGYCSTEFLVCGIHPSGPVETPCPDFAEVSEQFEPLGGAYYNWRACATADARPDDCRASRDSGDAPIFYWGLPGMWRDDLGGGIGPL